MNFRPLEEIVTEADQKLAVVEGAGLEKLATHLSQERSRKGIGDFKLTQRVEGFWDRGDTEIDLVAINREDSIIRFGSCKRSPENLIRDISTFDGHIERFITAP
jgi:hypothetical protein